MSRLAIARLLSAAVLLALLPLRAEAQFGALKRLKNKVSPDSATKAAAAVRDSAAHEGSAHDSAAIAAALAAHTKTDSAPQRSRLKKLASAAASASAKFEDLTGVSAT